MNYLLAFGLAFSLSLVLTPIVRKAAITWKKYDLPGGRHIHIKPMPRIGGFAMFISFMAVVLSSFYFAKGSILFDKHLLGFLLGLSLIVLVMTIDDLFELSWPVKIFFQFVSALILISAGIGIDHITNPFGGVILLDTYKIPLKIGEIFYHITLPSDLFTIIWVMGIMNIVNWLDGLDGLAAGISGISAFALFILSINIGHPAIAFLAIILAGSAFGFLPFNFHPAKIFMGDSGSHFLGYTIAALAILSGGKIATALLVLGIPILDGLWSIIRRIYHKTSPFVGDKKHLHHRLLEIGFSQKQIVLFYYFISIIFGIIALFSGAWIKFILLCALVILMAIILLSVFFRTKNKLKTD